MYPRVVIASIVFILCVSSVVFFIGADCDSGSRGDKEGSLLERHFAGGDIEEHSQTTEPIAKQRPPPVSVDSLSRDAQYDILNWNLVAYKSGSVDIVRTEVGAKPMDGVLVLNSGELIVLTGWAGHPKYGLRFRDVLFSLCGKVVGHASVHRARPDVAKAVHPNLGYSGWTAQLAADQLPRCEQQVLQAWGVAPIGRNIFPLNGNASVQFAGAPHSDGNRYFQQVEVLTPERNGAAVLKKITVRASALRVRKCGGTGCDVVGSISAGAYEGYVLEMVAGWTLIQIGKTVGWVSSKFLSAT